MPLRLVLLADASLELVLFFLRPVVAASLEEDGSLLLPRGNHLILIRTNGSERTRTIVVWDDPNGGRDAVVLNDVLATDLLLDSFITAFGDDQPAILGTAGADVINMSWGGSGSSQPSAEVAR